MVPIAWLEAIIDWAADTLQIKEVYLYGSRVDRSAVDDSDLDIAVVMADGEPDERLGNWIHGADEWQRQLAQLIPVAIHLEVADVDLSPCVVAPAVRRYGVRVYPAEELSKLTSE